MTRGGHGRGWVVVNVEEVGPLAAAAAGRRCRGTPPLCAAARCGRVLLPAGEEEKEAMSKRDDIQIPTSTMLHFLSSVLHMHRKSPTLQSCRAC